MVAAFRARGACQARAGLVSALMLASLATAVGAWSAEAPPSARVPSYPVSARAQAIVEPLAGPDLVDDDIFLSTLERVLRSQDLTAADRADALQLMLRKIGWGFACALRVPAQTSYVRVFNMQFSTFLKYQETLAPKGFDVTGLLELARNRTDVAPMRRANALLLAAMLDPHATRGVFEELLKSVPRLAGSEQAILVHFMSLSLGLFRDLDLGASYAVLLDQLTCEESLEDVLCALMPFRIRTGPTVADWLRANAATAPDLTVVTGFEVVARSMPEAFQRYARSLLAQVPAKRRTQLEQSLENPGIPGMPGPWIKTWDGMSAAIYDDGTHIYDDEFSDFLR